MNVLRHFVAEIAPYLQTLATAAVIAVAGKGTAVLAKIGQHQTLSLLTTLAKTYVQAVEQQYAKTLTNPEKKAQVMDKLHRRLPWVPVELIDAAIESAVLSLTHGEPVTL